MLVPVKYNQQQKYVKLDEVGGQYNFLQFHEKFIEKFYLQPDAKVIYKDATGTEVDAEIFSDFIGQDGVVLTVFNDDDFSGLSSASKVSDSSFSSSTIILDEDPCKRLKIQETRDAESAKQLIEAVLRRKSGGDAVLQEYQETETLTDATRRQMVNIVVAHMIDNHGHLPTKAIREEYALGIVTLFPSLKDPYATKGYEIEHFHDATSSTGYISWRLKTVKRKIRRGSSLLPKCSVDAFPGGPNLRRSVNVEEQLDGDACKEAISLLNHTADQSVIFQKMKDTFQHRQNLVNDAGRSANVLSTFPRFLDVKGLADQDFTLLFDDDPSSRLLQKWDMFFRPKVIKEAKQLSSTPELAQLLESAERPPASDLDETGTYDQEIASLLLLIHLLPPPPGGPKSPKISANDAVERLVVFHKSCCSLEEHLRNQQRQQPYLLAVGRHKSKIDITMDQHLIPCQANLSLGAFDELFKAHFVFNLSYDDALVNFYTFLQTTVYNIDVSKMKESPRVRDLSA